MFFVNCEKCGKRLIGRLPNGLYYFVFGKQKGSNSQGLPPVEMYIHGSLKMRCWHTRCGHMNTLNYFPNTQSAATEDSAKSKK